VLRRDNYFYHRGNIALVHRNYLSSFRTTLVYETDDMCADPYIIYRKIAIFLRSFHDNSSCTAPDIFKRIACNKNKGKKERKTKR